VGMIFLTPRLFLSTLDCLFTHESDQLNVKKKTPVVLGDSEV
jgi:hypothetical protein